MKAADLDILLQEGEGVMLEYKEGLSSSFARELVALANTVGGRILLGVRAQVETMEELKTTQVGTKLALSRQQVLNPLMEAGLLEMTVPEKPCSSKQRYRITLAGRTVLENSEKEPQS